MATNRCPIIDQAQAQHHHHVRSTTRIARWTRLPAQQLWHEWLARFDGDDDLALDAALAVAERLAGDHSIKQQEELRCVKRVLLRDAFSDTPYALPDGPAERVEPALPFDGLLKLLKFIAVRRAGFRPWDRRR